MSSASGQEADPAKDGARAARVRSFVRSQYSLAGSLDLHRAALGWDLLRAPVNVALAPVYLITRLLAMLAGLVRLRRVAHWLATRRVMLKSAVARRVEAQVRDAFLAQEDPARSARTLALLEDYTAVRSAVSEIATTLIVVAVGVALFRSATPGVVSLAPLVTERLALADAVAGFAFGETLGAVWYGLFPPDHPPPGRIVATGVVLAMGASVVTTFAGILADPLQLALGMHERRLTRLLARIDAAEAAGTTLAGEHVLARAADLSDAAVSVFRLFRP